MTPPQRIWYIDALRASMMILGVFLHAAGVYGADTSFPVRDPSGQTALDAFVHVVHAFRMPAFFLLAGLFWSHGLARNSLQHTLARRVLLVGLPFIALVLTLQPLQHALLLAHQHPDDRFDWSAFWQSYLAPGTLGDSAFTGRGFIGHLWFLPTLLLYYLLAAAALPLLRRLQARLPERWLLAGLRQKWLWALGAGGAMLLLRAGLRHGPWHPDYAMLVLYLPYFALGALAFTRPERFEAMRHLGLWDLLMLPAAAALVLVPGLKTLVPGAGHVLVQVYFALLASVGLLRLYQVFLDRSWPLVQRLVDASYSIYLFHYICVVCAAMLLLAVEWPALLEFALASAAGLLLPYALHRMVLVRWPMARLLFNGRWTGRRPERASAPLARIFREQ
jgi:glucan biosynthesis protein C